MGWLIFFVVAEGLIILYLFFKRPTQIEEKIIYRDVTEEERLKLDKELANRKAALEQTLAEEKEKSLLTIHKKEKIALEEINKLKEQKYNDLQQQIKEWELKQSESYQEFLKQQEFLKESKQNELNSKIIEIEKESEIKLKEIELQNNEIRQSLIDWKSKYDAAIEVYKNLEKIKEADNFYKISFSSDELEELDELNKVIKKLKNPMPFYKAIHDIYYKSKVSDLVLRVVGKSRVSGIYKITHIESGKCYVGQSVDIGDRWKQHIKRGVGADTLTTNKLYPALMELGIHNFTFEIVESTEDTTRLNEMEKYWQEFFQAKEFGYSMK